MTLIEQNLFKKQRCSKIIFNKIIYFVFENNFYLENDVSQIIGKNIDFKIINTEKLYLSYVKY